MTLRGIEQAFSLVIAVENAPRYIFRLIIYKHIVAYYGRPAQQTPTLYFCPVVSSSSSSIFFPRLISAVAD